MITVYGVPGWGSTISELMLSLADIPYEVVDVEGFDQPGPARERLRQINPLCQVPTLRLADGSIMTETAAIALMILDQRPDLAPAPGTPQRQQFQRLLVWLVANVYPTFTYADYPERWAPAAAARCSAAAVCCSARCARRLASLACCSARLRRASSCASRCSTLKPAALTLMSGKRAQQTAALITEIRIKILNLSRG